VQSWANCSQTCASVTNQCKLVPASAGKVTVDLGLASLLNLAKTRWFIHLRAQRPKTEMNTPPIFLLGRGTLPIPKPYSIVRPLCNLFIYIVHVNDFVSNQQSYQSRVNGDGPSERNPIRTKAFFDLIERKISF